MPQRFFPDSELRRYGLTAGDIRGRSVQRTPFATWRLPEEPQKILAALLERAGFALNLPIHVHEVTDPSSRSNPESGTWRPSRAPIAMITARSAAPRPPSSERPPE